MAVVRSLRRRRVVLAWLLRFVVLVAVVVTWKVAPLSVLTRQADDAEIESYDASYDLDADGSLLVTETVVVDLPAGKRGIFRVFDTADPRRPDVTHPVRVESVTRDGRVEPWIWNDSAPGTQTIRIGDEDEFIGPGEFTYQIVSRTVGATEPASLGGGRDGEVAWWWDVVGSGWSMPMETARVTASLPAVPRSVECVQGVDTPCRAQQDGASFTLTTGPLAPFTPVTVRTTFPEGALPVPPGSAGLPVLPFILLAVLAGAGAALGLWLATRERQPGFPVLFEPPEGIGPATGVRVLQEEDAVDDLQATLFDLGARGAVELRSTGDGWMVDLIADPATLEIPEDGRAVLDGLRLDQVGDAFAVKKTVSSGSRISTTLSSLRSRVAVTAAPYLERSWAGVLGRFLVQASIAAVIGAAVLWLGWARRVPWPLLLGVAAFALVGAGLAVDRSVLTTHSAAGRDLWSRVGGFARFLSTESSESRFDAAAHADWYPRYLGWATALGVADAWAARFEAQGVDVSEVGYVSGVGPHGTFTSSDLRGSIASAISGASATYAASVSSSSSGGGFSGGSGGGGGGGGSW